MVTTEAVTGDDAADERSAARERSLAEEILPRARFREFYEGLEDKQSVFYMFFTTGLLHWVTRALAFVPPEVNVVLIGSALTGAERECIAEHVDRPFHHVEIPVDDVTAWEFLFAANRHDFGWLDIDCFVLEPELFREMTEVPPGTSMNSTWSWDPGNGPRLASTHFLFLSVAAIRAVAELGVDPSPSTYDWVGGDRRFPPRRCFYRVPTARERELLLGVVPPDGQGRPSIPWNTAYFNTMVVYQLLAHAAGQRVREVRRLERRNVFPSDGESEDVEHWPEDMSDELFHVFGVSYYDSYQFSFAIRALYLAAEHVVMDAATVPLPPAYEEHHRAVLAELAEHGIDAAETTALFRRHLIRSRKLSPAAADHMMGGRVGSGTGA